ncbi:hypothetical protein VPH35_107630 [Triticum aestivum]
MKYHERVPDEEELLLFAHHVLPRCMAVLTNSSDPWDAFSGEWKGEHVGKVVELEFSLMYDILYTKATMIHSWYGYFFHVMSPMATIAALLVFHFYGKQGQSKIDVIITYILFAGALFLDMVSLVKAAFSTWTCDLLYNIPGGWGKMLCKGIQTSRRLTKAASCRRWSESIGQYNLFDACSLDMSEGSIRVLQMIKLDDWWRKYQYQRTLVVPSDIRVLLFQEIWRMIKSNSNDDLSQMFDMKQLEGNIEAHIEVEEVMFIWHIATNIFLSVMSIQHNIHPSHNFPQKALESSCVVEAIKALSNYMMYLAVARHDMLPALKLRSMCEKTSDDLQKIWSKAAPEERKEGFVGILAGLISKKAAAPYFRYDKRDYGTVFAQQLERAIGGQHLLKNITLVLPNFSAHSTPLRVEKVLELVLDAWVRMLVAASFKCSRESHAKQLSHCGELITIVWMLTEQIKKRNMHR